MATYKQEDGKCIIYAKSANNQNATIPSSQKGGSAYGKDDGDNDVSDRLYVVHFHTNGKLTKKVEEKCNLYFKT